MSIASNVVLENNALSNIRDAIIDKVELDGIPYYSNEDIKTLAGRLMFIGISFFRITSYDVPNKLTSGTTETFFTVYNDDFDGIANATLDVFINGEHSAYITDSNGEICVPITAEVGDTIELLVKVVHTAIFYKTFNVTE